MSRVAWGSGMVARAGEGLRNTHARLLGFRHRCEAISTLILGGCGGALLVVDGRRGGGRYGRGVRVVDRGNARRIPRRIGCDSPGTTQRWRVTDIAIALL